jgi:sugar phosphate isomerase/epimerase
MDTRTLIGAQLYIFRDRFDLDRDLERLLDGLAEAGYTAVEGSPGHVIPGRDVLTRHGMRFIAPHMVAAGLDDLGQVLPYLEAMEARDVCNSGPLEWRARTADDYRRTAAFLNERGRRLREQGVHLHYHNHDFEFEKVDGGERTAMDLLLEELDPAAVTLCLDVGWVWRGGADPVRFLDEHAARVGYLHLRDFRGTESVALGRGGMDLAPVIARLPDLPALRWVVVEQDPTSPDPEEDMRVSRAYLASAFGM